MEGTKARTLLHERERTPSALDHRRPPSKSGTNHESYGTGGCVLRLGFKRPDTQVTDPGTSTPRWSVVSTREDDCH